MAGKRQNGSEGLLLLAALAAIRLARDLSGAELELLSAFFEVLGDDLALLAAAADSGPEVQSVSSVPICRKNGPAGEKTVALPGGTG